MRACFGLLGHRRRFLAACSLYIPLAAWSVPVSAAQPESAPRWTLSIEAIVLQRSGNVDRTLVERVPGTVPFLTTFTTPGVEAFNSNQFDQGFSGGPKLSLRYRVESGFSVELAYFKIFSQTASTTIGPDSPADWLVMRAPGVFWQTQDFAYQGMTWSDATNLYSAELDGRWDLSSRITVLVGVRWLQLNDKLVGTLTPPDQTAPDWKKACPFCDIFHITSGSAAGNYPPF